jgi:hypothetical protein
MGYVLQAGARLCKCLGQEFLPYLPYVMPPLMRSVVADTDVQVRRQRGRDCEQGSGRSGRHATPHVALRLWRPAACAWICLLLAAVRSLAQGLPFVHARPACCPQYVARRAAGRAWLPGVEDPAGGPSPPARLPLVYLTPPACAPVPAYCCPCQVRDEDKDDDDDPDMESIPIGGRFLTYRWDLSSSSRGKSGRVTAAWKPMPLTVRCMLMRGLQYGATRAVEGRPTPYARPGGRLTSIN